jgi:CubicO group peptidase (beta-lactamase class C family)
MIKEKLSPYVERGEVPGLIALVARGDDVHVDVLGRQALGGVPLRRDSIFRISSMSKPLTAAAAMILVEDGALRLDEAVDRLLPELADRRVLRTLASPLEDTVPADRPIAVRDLLTFTLGFGMLMAAPGTYPVQAAIDAAGLSPGPPSPQHTPTPDDYMRRLGSLPLLHQPGARWMYNTGSDVLGVLIARAAGQPFEDVLRARLFEPLGMKDTGFAVPPAARDRLATSYTVDPRTGAMSVYDEPDGQWSAPPPFPSGGGGLVSTVDDYLAFARMLLARGEHRGRRVLSERAVTEMTRDQLTADQKARSNDFFDYFADHGWGYGVAVVTGRDVAGPPGTYGWDGGMGTAWRNDPARQAVTLLLTQQMWTSPQPPPVCHDFWAAAATSLGA